ncbi:MAG: response regulator [Candidatus Acidiferrales bacterium]
MFYTAQPYRERRESPKKNIRVVVADDSPVALVAICSFLETLTPITVVGTALSGYEALQKTEKLEPDLVITDLRMPHMSGLECALHLREIVPAIRVIVLTELEGLFVRQACLESGADACVQKSEMPDDLLLALRRLFPRVFERP